MAKATQSAAQRISSATSREFELDLISFATPTLKAALPTSCKSPPPSLVLPVAPPPLSASCYSSSDEISAVHVLKDKQEDLLVHLRHERQDLFEKHKNHGTLWNQIARD